MASVAFLSPFFSSSRSTYQTIRVSACGVGAELAPSFHRNVLSVEKSTSLSKSKSTLGIRSSCPAARGTTVAERARRAQAADTARRRGFMRRLR